MVRRPTSTASTGQKRQARHLRLVVELPFMPNLDAARGILNGLMMSSLFWLIALVLLNV
jgi:hypothetical protein